MSNFLSEKQLSELGHKKYGKNVLIGRHVVLYSPETLEMGDDVRIDDFTIISGRAVSYTHVDVYKRQDMSSETEPYTNCCDYYHNLITLPLHTLLSDEDVAYVCECFVSVMKSAIDGER